MNFHAILKIKRMNVIITNLETCITSPLNLQVHWEEHLEDCQSSAGTFNLLSLFSDEKRKLRKYIATLSPYDKMLTKMF